MELARVWQHIDDRRAVLADLLEGLPEERWRVPSLCAGWTARDVAAHLTLAQARLRDVLPWLVRTGSYNGMVRESAVERVLRLNERPVFRLRAPVRDVRLVATDTGWVWGEGAVVRGELRWLLMAVAGREAALERLEAGPEVLSR